VVARQRDDGVIAEVELVELVQDCPDTAVDFCDQSEISLFSLAVVLRRWILIPKEFLPETITERHILAENIIRGGIKTNRIKRMFVIEGTVVRRMRLEESNKQNKWLMPVALEKIAGFGLEKLRLGQLKWQRAGKIDTEILSIVHIWFVAIRQKELRVIALPRRPATSPRSLE